MLLQRLAETMRVSEAAPRGRYKSVPPDFSAGVLMETSCLAPTSLPVPLPKRRQPATERNCRLNLSYAVMAEMEEALRLLSHLFWPQCPA